ncbi:MAG TPA: condensation domain-containing protein, partial [Candidatus Acidoferrum sp.]|nr:condensation domain-containing protein [Candidatus Acidoferrum sp.]
MRASRSTDRDDLFDQRLAALSPAKRALLARARPAAPAVAHTIARRAPGVDVPLSFAQQRLWMLDAIEPESTAYNVSTLLRIEGPLDVAALERSIAELVDRHESLRTTFALGDDGPVQVVAERGEASLRIVDLSGLSTGERRAASERVVLEETQRTFDLRTGPLLRTVLVRVAAEEHLLVLVRHHIINDARSSEIYASELSALYGAFCAGQPSPLPPLPVQYGDYAIWQRERLRGPLLERELTYWKERLAGAPALVDLPTDRPRPAVQTFTGAVESMPLPADLVAELALLARRTRSTSFMLFLAAFNALLARYTGCDDLVVGTPITNRNAPELEGVIGFFVNTLALRTTVDPDTSFLALLEQVREGAFGAFEHQELPFEKLVEELRPERSLSHPPIVNVFFILQTGAQRDFALGDGIVVTPLQHPQTTAKFDLTLAVNESERGVVCGIEYNTDLFERDTIVRMLRHFTTLLRGIARNPQLPVGDLPLLEQSELQQIVVEWNQTEAALPAADAIHRLVEVQAERTPDVVAVTFADQRVTYRELNARADHLARRLRARGVAADVPVGVCLERSIEMITAVLAVLKAGGAYVPLDASYPPGRLTAMLEELPFLVTRRALASRLPPHSASVCAIEDDDDLLADGLPSTADPDALAYVIYTSGSTGRPKGVAMTHRPLLNLLAWQRQRSGEERAPRTLQFASLSFDVSFQEIFATLSCGGTLVLVDEETRRDASALLRTIVDERVERIFLPFVVLEQLVETAQAERLVPPALREVITAGEQLKVTEAMRAFFRQLPGSTLDNQYGPTEAHVVSAYRLSGSPDDWPDLPPIGRPIANDRLYVLDRRAHPVPLGVHGELYIGGIGLAR